MIKEWIRRWLLPPERPKFITYGELGRMLAMTSEGLCAFLVQAKKEGKGLPVYWFGHRYGPRYKLSDVETLIESYRRTDTVTYPPHQEPTA